MSRRVRFHDICAMIVARQGYNSGQSVTEIAALAHKSPATIRKWLRNTGLTNLRRKTK
jgi:uncharacterized protein YjcR